MAISCHPISDKWRRNRAFLSSNDMIPLAYLKTVSSGVYCCRGCALGFSLAWWLEDGVTVNISISPVCHHVCVRAFPDTTNHQSRSKDLLAFEEPPAVIGLAPGPPVLFMVCRTVKGSASTIMSLRCWPIVSLCSSAKPNEVAVYMKSKQLLLF